jgi:uncharacterized repeat protein (TIGR03803 family)
VAEAKNSGPSHLVHAHQRHRQNFAFLTAAGGRRILAVSIVPSQARLKPPPQRGHNDAYGSPHAHQSSHVRALVEATMYFRVLFALILALPAEAQSFQMLYAFSLRKPAILRRAGLEVNGISTAQPRGGMSNEGTVFELTSQGKLTSLYSFSRNTKDGRNPTIGPLDPGRNRQPLRHHPERRRPALCCFP